jgi:hypothetical protein
MAEELPKVKRQRFWCQAGDAESLSFCVPVLKQLRLDYTPKRRKIDEKFSQIMKKNYGGSGYEEFGR